MNWVKVDKDGNLLHRIMDQCKRCTYLDAKLRKKVWLPNAKSRICGHPSFTKGSTSVTNNMHVKTVQEIYWCDGYTHVVSWGANEEIKI